MYPRARCSQLIIDNVALIHSVFSEAFLVGVIGGVPTVMDLIDCREVCYLDVVAPEIHVVARSLKVSFASSTAGRTKLRIFLLLQ